MGVDGWTALQLRHSYVAPRPGAVLPDQGHVLVSEEAVDYVATEPGLAMWAYTPLLNGAYVRADRPLPEAYDHPGTERRLKVLADIADETGSTRNQVVLAWLMQGKPAICPIVGVSNLEQLDEAMAATGLQLDGEQRARHRRPASLHRAPAIRARRERPGRVLAAKARRAARTPPPDRGSLGGSRRQDCPLWPTHHVARGDELDWDRKRTAYGSASRAKTCLAVPHGMHAKDGGLRHGIVPG